MSGLAIVSLVTKKRNHSSEIKMDKQQVMTSQVRYVITAIGGYLVMSGHTEQETVDTLMVNLEQAFGAIMVIGSMLHSAYVKYKATKVKKSDE